MTHDDSLLLKRTGYLAVTLFLNEDHDLIILIVNTIQKDLKSDNYLVVCAALNVVCKLINEETIPAVLPQVDAATARIAELEEQYSVLQEEVGRNRVELEQKIDSSIVASGDRILTEMRALFDGLGVEKHAVGHEDAGQSSASLGGQGILVTEAESNGG
ncbi:hypothetical protein GH714_040730 [Hevea brasiliensis]|uniref:Clathrin/coatomer adaptor adaptin-like N-terminal domain-containing protein n=1 Tax=Hevea brasiliensis TaxID=3981 RepID=A0A6A6MTN4_HEVBR|nr:hypothetical protein GH714_040730 [Hevea brasiliensis]